MTERRKHITGIPVDEPARVSVARSSQVVPATRGDEVPSSSPTSSLDCCPSPLLVLTYSCVRHSELKLTAGENCNAEPHACATRCDCIHCDKAQRTDAHALMRRDSTCADVLMHVIQAFGNTTTTRDCMGRKDTRHLPMPR